MRLSERLNTLIQSATMSQKNGALTLDDAVKVKTAIDVISSGTLNQNYVSAINILIENAILSQKKGIFSLKDSYMIYLAIDGIENELQNEVNKINVGITENETQNKNILNNNTNDSNENVIIIPPKKLKKISD